MSERSADIAIVGAGVAGLAHAYHAARKGLKVVVFEKDHQAVGASVRNFGLVWPIGQSIGKASSLALRSREHWLQLADESGNWISKNGSLHLAYHGDEWNVLNEFYGQYSHGHDLSITLLSPDDVVKHSPTVNKEGLIGGLLSTTECTINSREMIRSVPVYLQEKYDVSIEWGTLVKEIVWPKVKTSRGDWNANHVIVCGGAEFETLYPEVFSTFEFTKCKLQMMKAHPSAPVQLGPSLCAGLTLRHYASFATCPSLAEVDARYDEQNHFLKRFGIHVLISQNNQGELIIGDSHEYGSTHDPFERESIYELIMDYTKTFFHTDGLQTVERWHGIYPTYRAPSPLIHSPEQGVTIVNGFGGAGMTLSHGVAECVISGL